MSDTEFNPDEFDNTFNEGGEYNTLVEDDGVQVEEVEHTRAEYARDAQAHRGSTPHERAEKILHTKYPDISTSLLSTLRQGSLLPYYDKLEFLNLELLAISYYYVNEKQKNITPEAYLSKKNIKSTKITDFKRYVSMWSF